MRNRGYKFIVKCTNEGYWILCVNATWINQILKDNGIRPRDFRRLTWEDLAKAQETEIGRRLFRELRPKNFWEMCDTMSLLYSNYELGENERVYHQEWFVRYPLFAREDIYELLLEEGLRQEDAVRVMEFVRRGKSSAQRLGWQEFLELYDVPEDLAEAFAHCSYLPPREKMVHALIQVIERAVRMKVQDSKQEESR